MVEMMMIMSKEQERATLNPSTSHMAFNASLNILLDILRKDLTTHTRNGSW
ncbi:hypothetical protein TanjilG_13824 [Lupinus angustifolius]|uniref:Uncharacterized protein n=1 Tax=Lupinus angustifolius TaxID=3871 RepID=A0A394DG77_LUPAN|nr:hypothetical protein TanjilG_13824 [Lupinus angustifolius]